MPKQSKGITKGLRAINSINSCVLKSNILDHRHVLVFIYLLQLLLQL